MAIYSIYTPAGIGHDEGRRGIIKMVFLQPHYLLASTPCFAPSHFLSPSITP